MISAWKKVKMIVVMVFKLEKIGNSDPHAAFTVQKKCNIFKATY